MLERALTQPQQCSVDPLNNALNWGIPIWSPYELQTWLEKIAASLKETQSLKRDNNRTGSGKELKVKQLKEPYIKFESYRRETRPVFLELQTWPTLNFDGDPGSCPFDLKRQEKKEVASINKEIKENREKYCNPNISKGKDMTRRPRATAARARKTENTGYCEICRIDYRNLSKHLQSDQHLSFVGNDKNFLSLDNLIGTGASVETFLQINRSKDVSKDCSLFSSRDHSLDNGILSSNEKSEKNDKDNLPDFDVDEMQMVQCNGARRNLNLKLDSPHNLRTRAKHESGHLLRSKGRPWNEEEKNSEKTFEKYVIKKRSKGTIWIEEEDSEDEKRVENEQSGCDNETLLDRLCEPETKKTASNGENPSANVSVNGDVDFENVDSKLKESGANKVTTRDNALRESFSEANTKANGYEKKENKDIVSGNVNCAETKEVNHVETNMAPISCNIVDEISINERFPPNDIEDTMSLKSFSKDDRMKCKPARRGGRHYRGRQRLSVEERLIEDNRDYYKVEVLGNKLRSSAIPSSMIPVWPSKEQIEKEKSPKKEDKEDDKPSSEKPVVVRFKRVRKSELSLLSDEAESFMFGDPRRDDDSSEASDGEQTSILPKDTESDREDAVNSIVMSSSPPKNMAPKDELLEDDSQESLNNSRSRKRRRTQTEALLMDNTDYYKFETPGSRLRYQAPLTGIREPTPEHDAATATGETIGTVKSTEVKVYPSKPSPEIEKMHFSFEAVPRSEPWYQTYQRQDEGAEYYYSESDSHKPFLLPYEIDNFQELLQKSLQSSAHRKRGRGRGNHLNVGSRSPRKSPRCHASTLAIMSTIIRRREQQQTTPLATIEEETKVKATSETTAKSVKKSEKSDVDEDLKELVKNLDDMLSSNDPELDSFEVDLSKNVEDPVIEPAIEPKGAPDNLLELLDNCHEVVQNGLDNSSCASSECGELSSLNTSKRRKKKKKNKTGWPGKIRRKLHLKNLNEELKKELDLDKKIEEAESKSVGSETLEDASSHASHEDEDNEIEHETGKENEQLLNTPTINRRRTTGRKRKRNKKYQDSPPDSHEVKDEDKIVLKSVSGDEITPRKKKNETLEKCKIEEDVVESNILKGTRLLENLSEDSEASLSNNENLCIKDSNLMVRHEMHTPKKYVRKHKRKNTASSEASVPSESENRRQSSVSSSPKKLHKDSTESKDLPLDPVRVSKRNQSRSKKKKKGIKPSRANCKNESFLSMDERKRFRRNKRNDSISSELQNGEMDSTLSERVSPSLGSPDVDQRRSSIDFQPVVRVMKIEDQVDMDNSLLSVTVASNRRLRSSSSPKTSMQPPKKRFRHGSSRRQLSRQWIKNS